jgi:hypothetical protein
MYVFVAYYYSSGTKVQWDDAYEDWVSDLEQTQICAINQSEICKAHSTTYDWAFIYSIAASNSDCESIMANSIFLAYYRNESWALNVRF